MMHMYIYMVRAMVFTNIPAISWRSGFLVEENGVPGKTTDLSHVYKDQYICNPRDDDSSVDEGR